MKTATLTRILVIFGTTDGQTRKVAHRIAATLRASDANVECDVIQAGHAEITPQYYGGIVVCASLHASGYQRNVARWVRRNVEALNRKPTAFVSVCLGVLQNDPKVDRDLDAIAQRFFSATGWQPTRMKIVAGALRYRQYGWLKRWIMKRIVAKSGGDTDTAHDYEYTDWDDLSAFTVSFIDLVVAPQDRAKTGSPA